MAKLPKIVSMEGRIFKMSSGPIRRKSDGRASVTVDFKYLGKVQGDG